MTQPNLPLQFSAEQKSRCCVLISMGCSRETACKYLGLSATDLRRELQLDWEFRAQLLRAEATPEFNHMRNLHQAAKDEKNWRASVLVARKTVARTVCATRAGRDFCSTAWRGDRRVDRRDCRWSRTSGGPSTIARTSTAACPESARRIEQRSTVVSQPMYAKK